MQLWKVAYEPANGRFERVTEINSLDPCRTWHPPRKLVLPPPYTYESKRKEKVCCVFFFFFFLTLQKTGRCVPPRVGWNIMNFNQRNFELPSRYFFFLKVVQWPPITHWAAFCAPGLCWCHATDTCLLCSFATCLLLLLCTRAHFTPVTTFESIRLLGMHLQESIRAIFNGFLLAVPKRRVNTRAEAVCVLQARASRKIQKYRRVSYLRHTQTQSPSVSELLSASNQAVQNGCMIDFFFFFSLAWSCIAAFKGHVHLPTVRE
jgi:hypothetical protein